MKTKVNKVPLVGPRGRRELLDRIEELEKEKKVYIESSFIPASPLSDYEVQLLVRKKAKDKTLLGCVLTVKADEYIRYGQFVSYTIKDNIIYLSVVWNSLLSPGTIDSGQISDTENQLKSLLYIQRASDTHRSLPIYSEGDYPYLCTKNDDYEDVYICVGGKFVSIEEDAQYHIVSYEVTNENVEEGILFIDVPTSVLDGLIGLTTA